MTQRELDLEGTAFADTSLLAGLHALEYLYAIPTAIADITPLAGLRALAALYPSKTNVTDVTPLQKLANLRYVEICDTPATPASLTAARRSKARIRDRECTAGLRLLAKRAEPATSFVAHDALALLGTSCSPINPCRRHPSVRSHVFGK